MTYGTFILLFILFAVILAVNSFMKQATNHASAPELHMTRKKRRASDKIQDKIESKPNYIIHDNVRSVEPYIHDFTTYAKGRWLNRNLLDVVMNEFGGHPQHYWENMIHKGLLKINNQAVSSSYIIKNGDILVHRTHRHEPPVIGSVSLIAETDSLIAVYKPPSLPMHPCGAYRFNSLAQILREEPIISDQPILHIVHRLDRVTSGLVILAKSPEAASVISKEIRNKSTKKTYLARVRGRMSAMLNHMHQLNFDQIFKGCDNDDNEDAENSNGYSNHEVKPKRLAQDASESKSGPMKRVRLEDSTGMPLTEAQEIDLSVHDITSNHKMIEVGKHPDVGYCYDSDGWLYVRCALGAISHRDGVHGWLPDTGKSSLSSFKTLDYCEKSQTSLVECRPYTGRTHQLRLHLSLIGNPIANDPCYGGELFYNDTDSKEKALATLAEMKRTGQVPLTRVPHVMESLFQANSPPSEEHLSAEVTVNSNDAKRLESETEEDYIIASCKYCNDRKGYAPELERLLHCDGIWLHAHRYEGKGWGFTAPLPPWAEGFDTSKLSYRESPEKTSEQEHTQTT